MRKSAYILIAIIAITSTTLHAETWTQISSEHFTVVTNNSEKDGRQLLGNMERLRWTFQKLFPKFNADADEPILVFATKNGKIFQSLLPVDRTGKNQLQLAGIFMRTNDENSILLRTDLDQENRFDTIYHEYTHFEFRKGESWMPLWLVEGIAEFYQNTQIENKEIRFGNINVNELLYLRQYQTVPVEVLFRVDHNSPYYHENDKGNIFYAESWALTHYLMLTDFQQKTDHIGDYLTRMRNHEDPIAAAQAAFGDLKKLNMALQNYVRAGDYKLLRLNSSVASIDETKFVSKVMTSSELEATKAVYLMMCGRYEDASAMADTALTESADNGLANRVKGTLVWHSGDIKDALKYYALAYKQGLRSLTFMNQYVQFFRMQAFDEAKQAELEALLKEIQRLYPDSASAYDGLAFLASQKPEKLKDALNLEFEAYKRDKTLQYLLNYVNIQLQLRDFAGARNVLNIAKKTFTKPEEQQAIDMHFSQLELLSDVQKQVVMVPSGKVESTENVAPVVVMPSKNTPQHQSTPKGAPRKSVDGTIQDTQCYYPNEFEFHLLAGNKTLLFFSNNFNSVDYEAAPKFTLSKLDPCHTMKGLKARVTYAVPEDNSADGEAFIILLSK